MVVSHGMGLPLFRAFGDGSIPAKGAEAQPSLGCTGAGGRQQTATRPKGFWVSFLCLCDNKSL